MILGLIARAVSRSICRRKRAPQSRHDLRAGCRDHAGRHDAPAYLVTYPAVLGIWWNGLNPASSILRPGSCATVGCSVSFALFALRVFKFRNQWNLLDLILLLNIAQVLIAFITHPFGLNASGSERVGARPYFNIAIATVGYFILSNQSVSPRLARRLPILMIVVELCSSALFLLSRASTSIGFVLGKVYNAYLPPTYHTGLAPTFERMTGVTRGGILLLVAYARFFDRWLCLHPCACGGPFCFYLGSR